MSSGITEILIYPKDLGTEAIDTSIRGLMLDGMNVANGTGKEPFPHFSLFK